MSYRKVFYLLSLFPLLFVFSFFGCQKTTQKVWQEKKPNVVIIASNMTLKEAYKIAKPIAVEKIGAEADIFNAITLKLNKDGSSNEWFISFGSPRANKSIAIVVKNGKVERVSPIVTINPEEGEDVTPFGSGWIDSVEVARAVPEAWETGKDVAMHYQFDSKAENNEGDTWQLISKNKFWNVDLYSGKLVNQGEQEEEIKIPVPYFK